MSINVLSIPEKRGTHALRFESETGRFFEIIKGGKAALLFSGGKDSVACLLLLRPYLAEISVIFVNPGRAFPEQLAIAEWAKTICTKWIEVKTDRLRQWQEHGLPSDLVPVDWTTEGQAISGPKPIKIQSNLACCWDNISFPALQKCKELGITLQIRGQRNDEERKATSRTGDELEGTTFWHPIAHWTKAEVLAYVKQELGGLPDHFGTKHSSLDCFDCPAYSKDSLDRVQFTRKYPELHRGLIDNYRAVYSAIDEQASHYRSILHSVDVEPNTSVP